MKSFFYYAATLWMVLWCQLLCNHLLGGSWAGVDLVLISTLYFGLSRGPLPGQFIGFVWGLFTDASSLGLMGLHSLLYAAAGYLAGMLRRQLDETKAWTQSIFTFGVSLLYGVLYFALERLFSSAERPLSWSAVAQPFLNALIAPVWFWLVARWSAAWSMTSVEHESW